MPAVRTSPHRPRLALAALALLLAAPAGASAASASLDPQPADPSACVEGGAEAPFWVCRVWSGGRLPLRIGVLDDAGAAVVDGTAVQLYRRLGRTSAWTPGSAGATTGGVFETALRPPRSAWYAAEAATGAVPATTQPLHVLVAARIAVPDSLGRQLGSRFTIRGRIAYAGDARGTLIVARCRRSDPRRCTADADFKGPLARIAIAKPGPFAVKVPVRGTRRNVFRLRYVPRNAAAFVASSRLVAIAYAPATRERAARALAPRIG